MALDGVGERQRAKLGQGRLPETGPAAKAAPGACQPLLGLYARPGLTHVVRVEWRDGRVAVAGPEPGSWRFPLSPTGDPEVFTCSLIPAAIGDPREGHGRRGHGTR